MQFVHTKNPGLRCQTARDAAQEPARSANAAQEAAEAELAAAQKEEAVLVEAKKTAQLAAREDSRKEALVAFDDASAKAKQAVEQRRSWEEALAAARRAAEAAAAALVAAEADFATATKNLRTPIDAVDARAFELEQLQNVRRAAHGFGLVRAEAPLMQLFLFF